MSWVLAGQDLDLEALRGGETTVLNSNARRESWSRIIHGIELAWIVRCVYVRLGICHHHESIRHTSRST